MKLDKQALHDPDNGYWCRVCEDCFKSRDGYFDTEGVIRSHTSTFIKSRTKGIERAHLEGNRLEKRLEKLAKAYTDPIKPANNTQGGLTPPLTLKHRRREQLIVKWEDDASVTNCPLCRTSFGKITNRKHHCRLCGRVVCEKCSSKISLNLNNSYSETTEQDTIGEIRSSQEIVNQTHADYQLAARTRKELLENFAQFDKISKKINSLSAKTESEKQEIVEDLRQQLIVLLEQEEIVQGYIHVATRKRKFDDVKTLKTSLDELRLEIDKKKKELGDL
ncbi:11074_t:CDS:2 [Diversispora eburnea]|uniref:11074_t:CDS:1 n=1 Tax=Diversispora eburnea TaxID=1213867 RepID=A0A9N8VH20_9GLOM|nr:11074_t:CDS:2 [Diversispora eburnea]